MGHLEVGTRQVWSRTFTEEDVRQFGGLSGDQGHHHLVPDAKGRLMVHGLLTATLPTKIGGDMNYVARQMVFEFVRPVFVGDTVECQVDVEKLEPSDGRLGLWATFRCVNQHGKEVMTGTTHGYIL